ncbi:MAG: hypothetical protein F4060_15620 [Holophagales bacterium]|nr:hypothetical protein [Holophagales bacterium]MYG31425.1 hypothetical protein [Holophagales bacterium]MYI81358.1 hypothetical protein [Holophagales bacterium]
MISSHGTVARRWSWTLLTGLLLALFAVTVRSDAVVAGERETTFRMAALSLAWDGDLTYGRADYDRYVRLFGAEPEAIALETSTGGVRIGFARPPAYAVLAAPFVRVLPRRGPALLNWLLLVVAAAGSALVLERRVGSWAPVWIAVFVAGTTAFTLVPLSSPGMFRLATSALAWALVLHVMPVADGERRPQGRRPLRGEALRWSLVGFLLILATVASVDGLSLLPALGAAAWLALLQPRRGIALLSLTVAAVLTAGVSFGTSALARGGAGPVERAVFNPSTGFPAVDFEPAEWRPEAEAAARAAPAGRGPDLRAAAGTRPETLHHATTGRTIGIVPYCVPLVWAALWGLFATGWRRVFLLGALASVAARVVFFPFDLGDESALVGPGGIGAVLPVFWFLAGRLGPARLAAVAASSALFLYPLWLRPGAAYGPQPLPEGALHRFLPAETGQRPRAGEPADLFAGDVWLRPVAGRVTPFGESGILIEGGSAEFLVAWEPDAPGSLEVGREVRRSRLRILLEQEDTVLEVVGGEVEESRPLSSGRTSVRLLLDPPVARHRMWWSSGPVDLFRLGLTLDGGEDPTSHRVLGIGSVP